MSFYQTDGKPLSAEAQHKQNLRRGVYHPPGSLVYGATSRGTVPSQYKSSSDQLSKEAIWQQKLKQGIYTPPGKTTNEPSLLVETSVYHTDDKPLSDAALYQKRLKLGVFQSPGAPIVGVNSTASDAAALLAASADLNVRPSYERNSVAADAQTAALAARSDSFASNRPESLKSELGVSRESIDPSSIYKRASSLSSTTSKNIPSRPTSSNASINISKINQLANKNSTKNLNSRFNPEQDYRSGLKSSPSELNDDEEELAASGAAASLKHGGSLTNSVSAQKRTKTFQAVDVVDAALLSAASKKAEERLGSLNAINQVDLKAQAQLYSKALVAAHKRSEERIANNKAGLVDLGGGLSLPMSEIDKMATLIVQPVIADIHKKANIQREQDVVDSEKRAELKNAHKKYQAEEAERKVKEKQDREREHQERISANEGRKRDEDNKYTEYQTGRHGEVDEQTEGLKSLKEEHAQQKEELLKTKQEKEDAIKEEETGLIQGRKEELENLQAERDEEIKPLLDELEEESKKLNELTDEKNKWTEEVDEAQKLHDENEKKVAELKAKLEETHSGILQYENDLEEAKERRGKADREIAVLQDSHKKDLSEHEEAHKDLNTRLAELNKQRESYHHEIEQHKKDILREIDQQVEDEHKINNALPEHLRSEVDESKFRDVSELFGERKEQKTSGDGKVNVESTSKSLKTSADEAYEPIKGINAQAHSLTSPKKSLLDAVGLDKKPEEKSRTTPKPQGKQELKPEIKADAKKEALSPNKSVPDGASVASTSSKRKGLRSRFSSFTSAFTNKSTSDAPKVNEPKKSVPTANHKASASDVSNYEDDLSFKDEQTKKGGVFKEEI